jgi:hypothetical protein
VSSREHWNDLNSTSVNHLSSHAWSKQHFQPKYTFGYEWGDRRDIDGMPVVRAIRTMTNQWPDLKKKFIGIMKEELEQAYEANKLSDGSSKIPLWETVKHFGSRINMLMMFGEIVGMFLDPTILYYLDDSPHFSKQPCHRKSRLEIHRRDNIGRGSSEKSPHMADSV